MRVLVTGATGLLGGSLLPELRRRGEPVRVLVLPGEDADRLTEQGIEVVRGDVTDARALTRAVEGVEVVIHLAGMMGVARPLADYRLVNVGGSLNMYRAAESAGVRRFVHASSHTVYGLGHGRFLTEADELRPDPDPYGISKAEGDRLVRRLMAGSRMETVIVRPGTFFGPGDRLHFARMAARLKAGRGIIIGRGRNALPFCYVTDVAQGFLLAAYHPNAPGNVFNISNDRPLTQRELFDAIADAVGAPRTALRVPYRPLYLTAMAAEKMALLTHTRPAVTRLGVMMFGTDSRHSVEKARRELGYEPRIDLREGVRLAARWFNAERGDERTAVGAGQGVGLSGGPEP